MIRKRTEFVTQSGSEYALRNTAPPIAVAESLPTVQQIEEELTVSIGLSCSGTDIFMVQTGEDEQV